MGYCLHLTMKNWSDGHEQKDKVDRTEVVCIIFYYVLTSAAL